MVEYYAVNVEDGRPPLPKKGDTNNKPGLPVGGGWPELLKRNFSVKIGSPDALRWLLCSRPYKDILLLLRTKIDPVVRAHLRDNGGKRNLRPAP